MRSLLSRLSCVIPRSIANTTSITLYGLKYRNISASVRTAPNLSQRFSSGRTAITLTSSAVVRAKQLLSSRLDAAGLRIGVRTRGCSGLSYTLDFCTKGKQPGDEVVEIDGVRIFIDRRAQLSLLGTEMDYQEGLLASEFVFHNPNVKSTCGCGESFTIT